MASTIRASQPARFFIIKASPDGDGHRNFRITRFLLF